MVLRPLFSNGAHTPHNVPQPRCRLVADDGDDFDFFGHAVAVRGERVVVGAPGASDDGALEAQSVVCRASGGTFKLRFGGAESAPIAVGSDSAALKAALTGMTSVVADADVAPFSRLCFTDIQSFTVARQARLGHLRACMYIVIPLMTDGRFVATSPSLSPRPPGRYSLPGRPSGQARR